MIPPFDANGLLPPGVHLATLAEIADRFGQSSELRRAQIESVRWMIDLARRAGVQRIVLNGSFVTDITEPNDVDCVLLSLPGRQRDLSAIKDLQEGLPFLSVAIVDEDGFDQLVNRFFTTDRLGRSKGMIEVVE